MSRRNILSVVLASFVATVMLATMIGCGPGPTPPSPTLPSPTPTPTPVAKPEATRPTSGGTLRVVMQDYPAGYDVHRKPSWGPLAGYPVYSSLVMFDPTKRDVTPANIIPDIAKSWETSSDGKVWTFHLQEGVTWHDGRPFTADDVVYNFVKMTDPKRSGVVECFPTFVRAEATDKNTVRVYLKEATPSLLAQLASPYTALVPPHKENVDWKTTGYLVGTGPFMFKSAVSRVSLELVRNPNYYKKDSFGTQLPYLDGVTYYTVADKSAATDAVITNRVDMTQPSAGISNLEHLERYRAQAPQIVIQDYISKGSGEGFFFNTTRDPLKDVRVRQALSMLIDRDALTMASYGTLDFAVSTGGFFCPPYGLAYDEIAKIVGWDKPWATRVSEAKRLLSDAGYPNGFNIGINVRSAVPEFERACVVLADKWSQANIKATVEPLEVSRINEILSNGNFDFVMHLLTGYVGDPEEILGRFKGGSAINPTGWSNPEVNALIDQQSTEMNVAKRAELVKKSEGLILKEAPAMPNIWSRPRLANWPYVKGYYTQDAGYCTRWKFERVWFDKTDPYWSKRPA